MKRFALLVSMLFIAMLVACGSTTAPTPKANLRVMHASPDAGLMDITLDDKKFLSSFPFKDAIGFNQVDAGKRSITFGTAAVTIDTTTTASVPLLNVTQDLVEGRFYTVIAANNVAGIEKLVVEEDNTEPPAGKLRLRLVHAAPAGPAVDIYVSTSADVATIATETAAISNVAFKAMPPALDIAPADYFVRVTAAGSKAVIFDSGKITLGAGVNLTLVAVEQNAGKAPISLVNLTRSYSAPRSELFDINAQLRFVHASPDIPAVDFLVNNVVTQSGLTYGVNSAYTSLVASTPNLKINTAGTSTTLIASDPIISGSNAYSVYLMGLAASPQSVLIADSLALPTAGNAKLRFVHASPDAVALDIFQDDSATAQITGLTYKAGSVYSIVPAGAHTYKFNQTATTAAALPAQTLTLAAGKIYTAVVLGSSVAGAAKPLTLQLITDR